MREITRILLFIWQLPQNLAGLGIILWHRIRGLECERREDYGIKWYRCKKIMDCGISLGDYIFMDLDTLRSYSLKMELRHEHGHQIQSRILGPFYLPVVGLSSAVFNNLWQRLFQKKWSAWRRYRWYYSRWPENWADRLGKVDRKLHLV